MNDQQPKTVETTEAKPSTLPKMKSPDLARQLLARFPGADFGEVLEDMVAICFQDMRWGNKREERQACDFLNEIQRIAIRNATKKKATNAASLFPELVKALEKSEKAMSALLSAGVMAPQTVVNHPPFARGLELTDEALTKARAILARANEIKV